MSWPVAKRLWKVSDVPRERRAQVPHHTPAGHNGCSGFRCRVLGDGAVPIAGELARGEEQELGLRQRLEQAMEQQRALRARGERCEARHRDLEATL